jgi:hypothetical protein
MRKKIKRAVAPKKAEPAIQKKAKAKAPPAVEAVEAPEPRSAHHHQEVDGDKARQRPHRAQGSRKGFSSGGATPGTPGGPSLKESVEYGWHHDDYPRPHRQRGGFE